MERISICILTFRRERLLDALLESLSRLSYDDLEIIVVDNGCSPDTEEIVKGRSRKISYIKNKENCGIEGRNIGIRVASGELIITLDDDVYGLDDAALGKLINIFLENERVGAVCFKVVDPETKRQINWCHHCKVEEFGERSFETNEISEGAVAFRRSAIERVGLYPSYFFISHEGADMACRLMDAGYEIRYCPGITVKHHSALEGRTNWRRYYFDTRNQIWFVTRNYPVIMGLKYLLKGLPSMLVYSIRDGYTGYWVKAIVDAIIGIKLPIRDRKVIKKVTRALIREIEVNGPGLVYMLKKRMFRKGVRI